MITRPLSLVLALCSFSLCCVRSLPVSAAQKTIQVGKYRQLFVDDHLIANMRGVQRVLGEVKRHPANPVLVSEHPWEGVEVYLYGTVLYDAAEETFKMWYFAWGPAIHGRGCYATSKDGIHWVKPKLGLIDFQGSTANNITKLFHVLGVIDQPGDPNPARRYKALVGRRGFFSRDGLHWEAPTESKNIPGDIVEDNVIPICYDELGGRYVAFGKVNRESGKHLRRSVSVAFSKDFLNWTTAKTVLIPDARDDELAVKRTADLRDRVSFFEEDQSLRNAQFYGMCAFPYQGMYCGLLWVLDASGWKPGVKKLSAVGLEDGPVQVELVSSRDLLHWNRVANRELLIPVGPKGSWDAGIIFTVNWPIVVGDEIWIYYGGIEHTHGHPLFDSTVNKDKQYPELKSGIGLATLRLDGWVSIDAAAAGGTLTTKPLLFDGKELVINASADGGSVAVEVLDGAGNPLPGFGKRDCDVLSVDAVRHTVTWRGESDLSQLADKPIRLRFHLRDVKLYSFVFRRQGKSQTGPRQQLRLQGG